MGRGNTNGANVLGTGTGEDGPQSTACTSSGAYITGAFIRNKLPVHSKKVNGPVEMMEMEWKKEEMVFGESSYLTLHSGAACRN